MRKVMTRLLPTRVPTPVGRVAPKIEAHRPKGLPAKYPSSSFFNFTGKDNKSHKGQENKESHDGQQAPGASFLGALFASLLTAASAAPALASSESIPTLEFNSVGDFLKAVLGGEIDKNQKIVIFLDVDGPLTIMRAYIEEIMTREIETWLKNEVADLLSTGMSKEKLYSYLLEACHENIEEEIDLKKRIATSNKDPIDILIKEVAFGYAMERSPDGELRTKVRHGQPLEQETLLRELLDALDTFPNLYIVGLTARPPKAAENFGAIMGKALGNLGLKEDGYKERMRKRMEAAGLTDEYVTEYFKKRGFKHPVYFPPGGYCIAVGQNNKGLVLDAAVDMFEEYDSEKVTRVGFIDDGRKYVEQVYQAVRSKSCERAYVIGLQHVMGSKKIAAMVGENPEISAEVGSATFYAANQPLSVGNSSAHRRHIDCLHVAARLVTLKTEEAFSKGAESLALGQEVLAGRFRPVTQQPTANASLTDRSSFFATPEAQTRDDQPQKAMNRGAAPVFPTFVP